jgi:hypothetical protein
MGENLCKQNIRQGINNQNLQGAQKANSANNQQLIEQTSLKRRSTNGQ